MGKLKVLPASIANLIAAGEVVQRPASAVKELLENAVDAGADRVDVIVKDSGRTLVQVIDNGCGMSPSDAVLCFERHATSKISEASDLEKILTYGFRGEALPSIAAVSEVTLKTRRQDDETATQVEIMSDGSVKTSSCAAPVGTNFAVRNLFFNTPARRKFLKSDNVELRHIIDEFIRVAIPHPEISFSLSHNGRDIYVLKQAKSLKFRIQDIFGPAQTSDIVDLSAHTSIASVGGFVARPDSARKTVANQYFFVGGRYFRSPYLHKAVMKAYEELLPDGFTPSYFIFIDLDPASVDVNIHPTKTEIKFEDDSIIFQLVYACVKETLGRNSFGASIDFDTEGSVELPQIGDDFKKYKGLPDAPTIGTDPFYDPFKASSRPDGRMEPGSYGALFETPVPVRRRAVSVCGKYIVSPTEDGVLFINAKRAMERILYEKTLRNLSKGEVAAQKALFPETVRTGASARLLFDENKSLLESLGFDFEPMGNDSIVVNGVPEDFCCDGSSVSDMIADLAEILSDSKKTVREVLHQNLASKIAFLGASGYTAPANAEEASALLDTLFGCDNPEFTPGGTKIAVSVSVNEIEKKFQ